MRKGETYMNTPMSAGCLLELIRVVNKPKVYTVRLLCPVGSLYKQMPKWEVEFDNFSEAYEYYTERGGE